MVSIMMVIQMIMTMIMMEEEGSPSTSKPRGLCKDLCSPIDDDGGGDDDNDDDDDARG